jgi:hypothetical protein
VVLHISITKCGICKKEKPKNSRKYIYDLSRQLHVLGVKGLFHADCLDASQQYHLLAERIRDRKIVQLPLHYNRAAGNRAARRLCRFSRPRADPHTVPLCDVTSPSHVSNFTSFQQIKNKFLQTVYFKFIISLFQIDSSSENDSILILILAAGELGDCTGTGSGRWQVVR